MIKVNRVYLVDLIGIIKVKRRIEVNEEILILT